MLKSFEKSAPAPGGEPDEFVMSDSTLDRVGDVVDVNGWELDRIKSDPVVLFNHDRNQVLGRWTDIRVERGKLIGRINWTTSEAWPMVRYYRDLVREGILRTVSVGFRAIDKVPLTKDASPHYGPFRFTKSELLECSLVSIPANPNALAIAKDYPREVVSKIFRKPATENRAWTSDRAHGKPAAPSPAQQGANMSTTSTVANKILNAQNDIQVLRDALNTLMAKEEMSQEDAERYAELPKEIDAAKAELEQHRAAERSMMDDIAQNRIGVAVAPSREDSIPYPVQADDRPALTPPQTPVRVFAQPKKRLEYPDLLLRAMACWTKAEAGHERNLDKTLREMYRGDEMTGQVLRAVTNPATTTTATWAAELTDSLTTGFLDRLIPTSVYNQLSAMGVRYTFGAANQLKIPVRTAVAIGTAGNLAGSWVGEGAAKPVRRASFATVTLAPTKLAVISTFTEEMATYSPYAIESIIRQGMADDTSIAIDTYLIDAVVGSATRPAGLLNGVGAITASVLTPATAAMVADLKALVAAITAQNGGRKIAILLNPAQALALGFAQTTTGDFLFHRSPTGRQQVRRVIHRLQHYPGRSRDRGRRRRLCNGNRRRSEVCGVDRCDAA